MLPQSDYAALLSAVLRANAVLHARNVSGGNSTTVSSSAGVVPAWKVGANATAAILSGISELVLDDLIKQPGPVTPSLPFFILRKHTGWNVSGNYVTVMPEQPLPHCFQLPDWPFLAVECDNVSESGDGDGGEGRLRKLQIGLGVGLGVGGALLLLAVGFAAFGTLQRRQRSHSKSGPLQGSKDAPPEYAWVTDMGSSSARMGNASVGYSNLSTGADAMARNIADAKAVVADMACRGTSRNGNSGSVPPGLGLAPGTTPADAPRSCASMLSKCILSCRRAVACCPMLSACAPCTHALLLGFAHPARHVPLQLIVTC